MRRDGSASTVLIGGQGVTIGALTPAVVTSLGTFIGGSPAVLGTSLLQQPVAGTFLNFFSVATLLRKTYGRPAS